MRKALGRLSVFRPQELFRWVYSSHTDFLLIHPLAYSMKLCKGSLESHTLHSVQMQEFAFRVRFIGFLALYCTLNYTAKLL
jgi:hypothetical protein